LGHGWGCSREPRSHFYSDYACRNAKTIREQTKPSNSKVDLADIRLIVADASAFQPDYKSDRRMGAKFGAPEKLANGLVKELLIKVGELHKSISGRENGIRIVYLLMPADMRTPGRSVHIG
jgi:hypothetical protein